MGLSYAIDQDPSLAALQPQAGFAALVRRFAANAGPQGAGRVAFHLPDRAGIIEGLARDAAGHWFFGDVRERCVWRLDPAGRLERFAADPSLLGVFGLKVDDAHRALWAGTAAVPEMRGAGPESKGRAALVEFDLADGRVRHSAAVPADGREHVLGDVLLAPDGSVFASDSLAPVIWRLPRGGDRLQRWLESDDFVSLQGLALAPDGHDLIVADYANGLWRISLADQSHALLRPPTGATLFGIDGLYAVAGGLVAVQNGVAPQRIVRLRLDAAGQPAALTVVEAGHEAMNDVSLGAVAGDQFHFIGNSGWSLYEQPGATPAPRAVTVFQTRI